MTVDGECAHVRINSGTKVGTRHGQWVGYVVTVTAKIRR
nr:hypothetical protein [uncultured bacterium]